MEKQVDGYGEDIYTNQDFKEGCSFTEKDLKVPAGRCD
jgi:hypothetical protein